MYLMRRIQLFMAREKMSASKFGRCAVNDPRLLHDIKRGRELREKTAARISAWLDAQEKGREEAL